MWPKSTARFSHRIAYLMAQPRSKYLIAGATLIALVYLLQRGSISSGGKVVVVDPYEVFNNPLVEMDDPRVIAMVRHSINPPSNEPYNFNNADLNKPNVFINPSAGQTQAVEDILIGFGKNGFFLDIGANDGEWYSNTVWVERALGWSGLLLEPDPKVYPRLMSKKRKAYTGNFCLSETTYPTKVDFFVDEALSGLGSGLIKSDKYFANKAVKASCYPLYSVLLAMNRTTVDWFSLDIEGSELRVLRTVPFDRVIFKVITIEHNVLPEGKKGLREFMEAHGYIFYRTLVLDNFAAGDSIFIHKSVSLTAQQRAKIGIEDKEKLRPVRV